MKRYLVLLYLVLANQISYSVPIIPPLYEAALTSNYDQFKKLLQQGDYPKELVDPFSGHKINLLQITILGGNIKIVKELLDNNVFDINVTDSDGNSALHAVVLSPNQNAASSVEMIQLLISQGINKNIKNSAGQTAYDLLKSSNSSANTQIPEEMLNLLKPD